MLDQIIIIIATDFIIISGMLAVATLFLLKSRSKKVLFLIVLVVAGILALIFSRIGNNLIHSPRPFVERQSGSHCEIYRRPSRRPLIPHGCDNGFPSDHTLLSSLIGFAILPFSPGLGVVGLILALLIGAARVFANVHHWIDIAGGFAITGAAVVIAYYSVKAFFTKTRTGKKLMSKLSKLHLHRID